MRTKYIFTTFLLAVFAGFFSAKPVFAQGFSGSDISNYQCATYSGLEVTTDVSIREGRYVCYYSVIGCTGGDCNVYRDAVPRPPQLRVIEQWAVRVLYLIWGFAGISFTGLLIWIGFKYMTSFDNDVAKAEVIKDFRKWIVGLALIFLSYPALSTLFRILPISQTECYADLSLPAFQFFFPTACVSTPIPCEELFPPGSDGLRECLLERQD